MTTMIRLDDVHKSFPHPAETVHAIAGVSLTLDAGSITALAGPSGSGKTTLINLIVGWDEPDLGTVIRDDAVAEDWASIAIVPQELGLLPELSIAENATLPRRIDRRLPAPTPDLLDRLHLSEVAMRLPEETSLGEQQRAAVARAILAAPLVLIADEPTSHQDEDHALDIVSLLRDTAREGSAVLVATHDERVLEDADRIVRIEDGRLVAPRS